MLALQLDSYRELFNQEITEEKIIKEIVEYGINLTKGNCGGTKNAR